MADAEGSVKASIRAELLDLLGFLGLVVALLVVRVCLALFDDAPLERVRVELEEDVRTYAYGPAPIEAPPVPRGTRELSSALLARGAGMARVARTEVQT